jgi:hypothetical protein
VIAVCAGVSWVLVKPPVAPAVVPAPSTLLHGLFERANASGEATRATASPADRTDEYQWIDRSAGIVRIPIERAIDAVAANPSLIRFSPAQVAPSLQSTSRATPPRAAP